MQGGASRRYFINIIKRIQLSNFERLLLSTSLTSTSDNCSFIFTNSLLKIKRTHNKSRIARDGVHVFLVSILWAENCPKRIAQRKVNVLFKLILVSTSTLSKMADYKLSTTTWIWETTILKRVKFHTFC